VTKRVRPPAVAGTFYPDDAAALASEVDRYVHGAHYDGAPPKAIIVPHAGYVYSGPIAGSGYAAIAPLAGTVERVLLLGPAHRVPLQGLAVPSVDAFVTPLGAVEIDDEAREIALACEGVAVDDVAHAPEHSLEVHLPFLQRELGTTFRVLPLVVGHASPAAVAAVLDALWGGDETLIVISTDLSHYEDYESARAHDARTAAAILAGDVDAIDPYDACGAFPVRGMLAAAREHALDVQLLDARSSGDTAGSRDRVVGYGAFALTAR
jgi:AmmeMemoRadiSam system protein B